MESKREISLLAVQRCGDRQGELVPDRKHLDQGFEDW